MACSTLSLDVRDWDLDDPHGADPEEGREIRGRVESLFDDIEAGRT